MKAFFRTNLDEAKRYVESLNASNADSADFAVGDLVRVWINRKHPYGSFPLRVVARTLDPVEGVAEIELHMPHPDQTIGEWVQQMNRRIAEVTK